MTGMEPDGTSSLRKKISRLGRDLERLSRAMQEEIDAHEGWKAAADDRDGATHSPPHNKAD